MADCALRISIVVLSVSFLSVAADFTANCPAECKCMWAYGNKLANCSHSDLHDIPNSVTTEIQSLDLTGNDIKQITRHAFEYVGLVNLKKLVLRECNLTTIDKNALSGLSILTFLDISKNNLKTLHAEIFQETPRLRGLWLSNNQIEALEDGLFNNLLLLKTLDLSNNLIAQIGVNTFTNMPKLESLNLSVNKLEYLEKDTLSALTSIYLLVDLRDNPWRCDCNLQPVVSWVIRQRLSMDPIACSEPAEVRGKLWSEVVFHCD